MLLKKYLGVFILTGILSLFLFVGKSNAQMMGNFYNQPTVTPTQQDLQDIQTGKELFTKFQNKQITCSNLKDDDFEKIGEYVMNQRFGNSIQHIQMNNNMKNMMGSQAEENMHIKLGQEATNCYPNEKGGGFHMMGWGGYGYGNMMGGFGWGFGFIHVIIALIVVIDLILLGVFLWKQIKKSK